MLSKSWTFRTKFAQNPTHIWRSEKHREDFQLAPATHKVLHVNYDSTSQHVFLAAVMVKPLLQGLTTREGNNSSTGRLQIHLNVTSRRTFRPLPHTTESHFLHSVSPGFDNEDDFLSYWHLIIKRYGVTSQTTAKLIFFLHHSKVNLKKFAN
jgi:hypothetical protein